MCSDLEGTLFCHVENLTRLAVCLLDDITSNGSVLVVEEESGLGGHLCIADNKLIGLYIASVHTDNVSLNSRQSNHLSNNVNLYLFRNGRTRLCPGHELTRSGQVVLVHTVEHLIGSQFSTVEGDMNNLIVALLERYSILTSSTVDTCQGNRRNVSIVLIGLHLNHDIINLVYRTNFTTKHVQTCCTQILHILRHIVCTSAYWCAELISNIILYSASFYVNFESDGVERVEVDGHNIGRVTVHCVCITLLGLVGQLGEVEEPPAQRLCGASLDLFCRFAVVLVLPAIR